MRILYVSQVLKKILKDRSIWLYALVFLVFFGLDLLSKHLASPSFKNYYFAFSIQLPVWAIYGIYFVVAIGIIEYLRRNFSKLEKAEKFAWVLIISGAILNIAERLVLGYVRDFIYITFFNQTGIYNFADVYILSGVLFLIAFNFLKGKGLVKSRMLNKE